MLRRSPPPETRARACFPVAVVSCSRGGYIPEGRARKAHFKKTTTVMRKSYIPISFLMALHTSEAERFIPKVQGKVVKVSEGVDSGLGGAGFTSGCIRVADGGDVVTPF